MSGIVFEAFFATSLKYYFQYLLSHVSWYILFAQKDAPIHQARDSDIKADSILCMIMSDPIFQRLLKKFFW